MKRIFTIASLLLLFVACQKEDMPYVEVRDCLVTINTIGDISITESDLTRGSASLNDLYAVQVYKNGSCFALGIFDDVSKMQLNLKTGSTYDFRMCMVKDAKSLLKDYFSLTNNGINWGVGSTGPFYCGYYHYVQTNRFFYNSNGYYN